MDIAQEVIVFGKEQTEIRKLSPKQFNDPNAHKCSQMFTKVSSVRMPSISPHQCWKRKANLFYNRQIDSGPREKAFEKKEILRKQQMAKVDFEFEKICQAADKEESEKWKSSHCSLILIRTAGLGVEQIAGCRRVLIRQCIVFRSLWEPSLGVFRNLSGSSSLWIFQSQTLLVSGSSRFL